MISTCARISANRRLAFKIRNTIFVVFLFNSVLLLQHFLITLYSSQDNSYNHELGTSHGSSHSHDTSKQRRLNSYKLLKVVAESSPNVSKTDEDTVIAKQHDNITNWYDMENKDSYIIAVRNLMRIIMENKVTAYKLSNNLPQSAAQKFGTRIPQLAKPIGDELNIPVAQHEQLTDNKQVQIKMNKFGSVIVGKRANKKWVIDEKAYNGGRSQVKNISDYILRVNKTENNFRQRPQEVPNPNLTYVFNNSNAGVTNNSEFAAAIDYYKKQDHIVNEYNYHYTIEPKENKCTGDVFMIILIHSKPDYHDRRDAIRQTWGTVVENAMWPPLVNLQVKIRVLFVTGYDKTGKWNELLHIESKLYDDVIQGNFVDDYKNMTLKSLMGLQYVSNNCKHVPYMLKSDDDMFINIPFLIDILQVNSLSRTIMGPFNVGSKVLRRGKWKLSWKEFPFTHFPPYESGSAYIITTDIVTKLYETSKYVPWIFIDDVYVTGILGRIIDVNHDHRPGLFSYWTNKAPTPCAVFTNYKVTFTKATPKVLTKLWGALQHRDVYEKSCHKGTNFEKPKNGR